MKRALYVFLALAVAIPALGQGFYWQAKTEGSVGESTTENFAMPKMFKTVIKGGPNDGSVTIMRLDKQVFWTLDSKKKTYSELTFDEMEKMASKMGTKMDAAMEKMNKELADMPKEQREMMMKMMGGKMPGASATDAAIEVKKTSERKTISGYATTKYQVRQDGNDIVTLWITKDVKGFEKLMADWKQFANRMSSLTARFGKGVAEAYKDVDGFPMQTTATMMNQSVTTTVTKLENRSTPASEFDVPAGYTKVKSSLEDAMRDMESDGD